MLRFLVASFLAAAPVHTPGPQDIPRPVPGDVGLAGSPRPDISRFLQVRSARSAQLSPDGQRASFLSNVTGQPQLWVTTADGAPEQLTFGDSSVTFQQWSPTGEWIAYGTDRAGNEREGFYLVSPDGRREVELVPPSDAFRAWGGFSLDGRRVAFTSTERNGLDFDVYVMDVSPGGGRSEPRRVLEGKGRMEVAAWRPDGKALLLASSNGEVDEDLFLLELPTGALKTVRQPEGGARYAVSRWMPDGSGFYVATDEGRDLSALGFLDVGSGKLRWLDEPSAEVEQVALSRDGRYLAWALNQNGYSALRLKDLRTGKALPVPKELPEGIYGLTFAQAAPVLGIRVAGPRVPGDLWALDMPSGKLKRMTRSSTAGLDPSRFVVPEAVTFKAEDGEAVHGLLYLPPQLPEGTKPPVLLGVHGGPSGQSRPAYIASFQYLLTRGIAVLDLNYRGSVGYGKRFTRLDNGRLRMNQMKDLAAALDFLGRTGKVDASRAAIMGGSYGGYLTLAALTQLPDRFKAGVSSVGVSNWVTALQGASPELKASDRVEYGNIDDPKEREYFASISPLTHVKRVKASLMVIHGANDPRDPPAESDQFVRAIREQGGEVEYLRFPDEGHSVRKVANQIILYRRAAAFLQRTLGVKD